MWADIQSDLAAFFIDSRLCSSFLIVMSRKAI